MFYTDINKKIEVSDFYVLNDTSIQNAIDNILGTEVGSVPGHPEFGSRLTKFLFELMDQTTIEAVKNEIEYSLSRWEPRIKVNLVHVFEDLDYNRITITIKYTILSDVNNTEYSYIFKQQN
jgi:phage baseplate assembly protein W